MKKLATLIATYFCVILHAQKEVCHNDHHHAGEIAVEAYIEPEKEEGVYPFSWGYIQNKNLFGTKINPTIKWGYNFAETKNSFDFMVGHAFNSRPNISITPMLGLMIGEKANLQLGLLAHIYYKHFSMISISQLWGNNFFSMNEIWWCIINHQKSVSIYEDGQERSLKFNIGAELEYLHPSNEKINSDKEEERSNSPNRKFGVGPTLKVDYQQIFFKLGTIFVNDA